MLDPDFVNSAIKPGWVVSLPMPSDFNGPPWQREFSGQPGDVIVEYVLRLGRKDFRTAVAYRMAKTGIQKPMERGIPSIREFDFMGGNIRHTAYIVILEDD